VLSFACSQKKWSLALGLLRRRPELNSFRDMSGMPLIASVTMGAMGQISASDRAQLLRVIEEMLKSGAKADVPYTPSTPMTLIQMLANMPNMVDVLTLMKAYTK